MLTLIKFLILAVAALATKAFQSEPINRHGGEHHGAELPVREHKRWNVNA
jgi:hypothetical protein